MSHPSTAAPRRAAPPWAGELPPKKVAWLHPIQLLRTAYHAWISAHAQELLDRRETLAALDRTERPDVQAGPRGCVTDAASDLRHGSILTAEPTSATAGGIWIDYVADVGDSWEATYAVAALLAAPHLQVRGWPHPLPSADIVVLGGDLVYPTATREGYRSRLRWPLASAYPEATRNPAPCLLAVPGNHDWYDGLNNFVREFCQGGFLGGWRLVQHRSYFAVKLMDGWWLWGIDIALDTRIDPPQQAYFLDVLKNRSPGEKIILCTAKPSWLEDPRYSDDAYRNLTYFVTQVIQKHEGSVPIILAGDLHHYSRYENAQNEQLIVAGGGGAYLNGTHHLPLRIEDLRSTAPSDGGREAEPPRTDKFFVASDCSYPRRYESRRLAFGAVLLAFRTANWPFCLFVGLLYWLLAWPLRRALPPLAAGPFPEILTVLAESLAQLRVRVLIAAILMVMTSVGFSVLANRGPRWALTIWGAAAAFAHIITALLLACLVSPGSAIALRMTSLLGRYDELAPYFLSVLFVLVGGVAGGTLFGLYLVLSDAVAGLHRNEVFASQSIIDYRSFVRLYIGADGSVRVFPIGLRRVPRKWRARPGATPQPGPHSANRGTSTRSPRPSQQHPLSRYEPADDVLAPHLIEGPIEIPKSR